MEPYGEIAEPASFAETMKGQRVTMTSDSPDARQGSLFDGTFVVLAVLFALSLSLNVWQGALLRSRHISYSPHSLSANAAERTLGGQPRFTHLIDLAGHPTDLRPAHNLLIYMFSPTCKWCDRNLVCIQDLVQQIAPQYQVIGLVQSPDGVAQYLTRHPLPFQVMVDDDLYDTRALDLQGTPQTVLLVEGKVVHNWPGAYTGKVKESIQHALGVSIADMTPESH